MGKKKKEDKRPFAIQEYFMHKAKPWKNRLIKSDGALNIIIRRLKCKNAAKIFDTKSKKASDSSNSLPKYPFLTRNLEKSFNNWSSFEQKCREYASKKESNKVEDEPDHHTEPIVEFPPDEGDDHSLSNIENVPDNDESKNLVEPAINSGLTRWKNTMELMPSPIIANKRNKHCLNDCSFETVRSLPNGSPVDRFSRKRKPTRSMEQELEPTSSTTMHLMDRSMESCLPSTPSFMREWKAKSKRRQLHSTPKNAFI